MPPEMVVQLMSGMLVMGYAAAGLFFLRFWRESRDRLFAYFATAFFLLAVQRALFAMTSGAPVYILRLAAFVLILWAIIEKNRSS